MHMHAPTTAINSKCLKLNQAAVADCWHAFSSQNAGLSINIYNAHPRPRPRPHRHCQNVKSITPTADPGLPFFPTTTNIFFPMQIPIHNLCFLPPFVMSILLKLFPNEFEIRPWIVPGVIPSLMRTSLYHNYLLLSPVVLRSSPY
jgi:hypothetical protein